MKTIRFVPFAAPIMITGEKSLQRVEIEFEQRLNGWRGWGLLELDRAAIRAVRVAPVRGAEQVVKRRPELIVEDRSTVENKSLKDQSKQLLLSLQTYGLVNCGKGSSALEELRDLGFQLRDRTRLFAERLFRRHDLSSEA